jgi:hypothetical protein
MLCAFCGHTAQRSSEGERANKRFFDTESSSHSRFGLPKCFLWFFRCWGRVAQNCQSVSFIAQIHANASIKKYFCPAPGKLPLFPIDRFPGIADFFRFTSDASILIVRANELSTSVQLAQQGNFARNMPFTYSEPE